MSAREIKVSATEFKAKCLDLFKRLERGKLKRITVTRRGSPVAEIAASRPVRKAKFADVYGCMRGTIDFAPDYDPFEQVIAEPEDSFLAKKRRRGSAA